MTSGRRPVSEEELARARVSVVRAVVGLWHLAQRGGVDLPGQLAEALQEAAATVGGPGVLVRSRPDSWEAQDIQHLAATDADMDLWW